MASTFKTTIDPNFMVMPCFSLSPNSLSLYNKVYSKLDEFGHAIKKSSVTYFNFDNPNEPYKKVKLEKQFHNFELSNNAFNTLRSKINWLYYFSKKETITTYSGKIIYNYKMSFTTLTLPASQFHTTAFITNNLFNQFLTEVRNRTGLTNYVWRLEFQKNSDVHYHIVHDIYLDYFFVQKIWNRILSKAGYIAKYQEKHKDLSLYDYNKLYNSNKKTPFSLIAERYAKGKKNKWTQPNSVDVRSVVGGQNIAGYIAKYFKKSDSVHCKCNALDNAENSKSLRLWFCSRSLSKLKKVTDFCEAVPAATIRFITDNKLTRFVQCDWAKMFYFDLNQMARDVQLFYFKIFTSYARDQGYPVPV